MYDPMACIAFSHGYHITCFLYILQVNYKLEDTAIAHPVWAENYQNYRGLEDEDECMP